MQNVNMRKRTVELQSLVSAADIEPGLWKARLAIDGDPVEAYGFGPARAVGFALRDAGEKILAEIEPSR